MRTTTSNEPIGRLLMWALYAAIPVLFLMLYLI